MYTWVLVLFLFGEPLIVKGMPSEEACRALLETAPVPTAPGMGAGCFLKKPREVPGTATA